MTTTIALAEEFNPYFTSLFKRKAKSITAIDVKKLTSYTDMIVIVEGESRRQVTSLAEHLIQELKQKKIKPLGMEGIKEGEWALIDYGQIIIHVFESNTKAFYDLEGLWSDAPRVDLSRFSSLLAKEEKEDEDEQGDQDF